MKANEMTDEPVTILMDLDGTLCDFDSRVKELTGFYPHEFGSGTKAGGKGRMWQVLARAENDFYNSLEWLDGCRQMWNLVVPASPIVLTGLPMGKWAAPQKRTWCARELGPEFPVITCMADDKPKEALTWLKIHRGWEGDDLTGAILVDDRLKTRDLWEGLGGTFVLHTDPQTSIAALKELGAIR